MTRLLPRRVYQKRHDSFAALRLPAGTVATITMRRPNAANALSAQLIDEIDGAFDLAAGAYIVEARATFETP